MRVTASGTLRHVKQIPFGILHLLFHVVHMQLPRFLSLSLSFSLSLSLQRALALLVYDSEKKGLKKGSRVFNARAPPPRARARKLWLSKLRVTFSKNERVHSISKREQRERPVRRILFGKNLTDEYRRKAVSMRRVFEYTCFM